MPDQEVLGTSSEGMQLYSMGSSDQPGQKSGESKIFDTFLIMQVSAICGPEKESCVANQTLKDKSCLVPCTGLYADIEDNSLKHTMLAHMMAGRIFLYLFCICITHIYDL